jgi:hypothetical protein
VKSLAEVIKKTKHLQKSNKSSAKKPYEKKSFEKKPFDKNQQKKPFSSSKPSQDYAKKRKASDHDDNHPSKRSNTSDIKKFRQAQKPNAALVSIILLFAFT